MASTTSHPAPSVASTEAGFASSRLLLWLPVPAVVLMAHLLIRGDLALAAGVADLDPLYGLTELFIGAAAVVIGAVPLVMALVASFGLARSRGALSLVGALWTAVAGVVLVLFVSVGSARDDVLAASTSAGSQYGWQVAAAVVAVLPLAVVLVVRRLDPSLTGGSPR